MKKLFTLLFLAVSLMASAQCTWPKVYNSAKYLQFAFDKQGEILGQFSHDNFASNFNHVGVPTTPVVSSGYNESCAKYSNNGTATWMFNENYGFATIIPFDNGKFFLGSFTSRILNPNGSVTGITFPTAGYTYHEGFSNQLLQFNGTTLNAMDINTGSTVNTSSLPALANFIISATYVKGSSLYLIGHYFSTTNYDNNVIIKLNSAMTIADVKTTALNIRKMAITNPGVIYLCLDTEIGTFNWTTAAYTATEVTGYSILLKYDATNTRIVYFNAGTSTVKFIYDSGSVGSYAITVTGTVPTFGIEVDYYNNELLINGSNTGGGGGSYNGSSFPYLSASSYQNVILHKISMQRIRASFIVRNQNVCPGTTITYYSNSAGNPTNYNWSFPGGSPSTSTLPNPTVTYCNAGLYNASLMVSNCTGSSTATYTNFISASYANCSEPGCVSTLAKSFGSTNYESALSVITDAGGNIYTTGRFTGTVDFDPGAGVSNLTSTTTNYDVYITKFDAYGNFIWVKQLAAAVGSTSIWNKADDMVIDNQGNLYLSGTFAQTLDVDPGAGVFNLTSGASAESFVLKLNTCGEFIWAQKHGGAGAGTTTDIAIDNANNIYISGLFANTINIGSFTLTGAGNWEGYVARMNTAGSFLWAKRIGSSGVDYFTDVKTNSVGSVVLTGLFSTTVDFDPNAGVFNLTAAGSYDAFVLTLDAAGNFVWAKRTGNTGDDAARELVITSADDIILMGDYMGVVDFDPNAGVQNLTSAGGKDVSVLRLSSAGNYVWAGSMGNASDNYPRSMSIDGADNVYLSGDYSSGTLDVDPTTGVFNLGGTSGCYISKINSSNAFVWGKKIDAANITSMWNNSNNDLIAAGAFTGTTDFDINAGVINLSSNGNTDAFVAKYCSSNLLRVAKTEEESTIATSTEMLVSNVLIYPNPSPGQVFVSVPAEWTEGKITVYNSVGQIVMTGEVSGEHQTELSLESLKDGFYFINVSNSENSITEKLIKNTNK